LKEILETGLAEEDRDGLLIPSRRLSEARSNQQGISLEEIVNYNQSFVVDNLTCSLQPRADDKPLRGLPTYLPVSLDIYATPDPMMGLRLQSELIGFPEHVKGLLTTSGLHGEVNKFFDEASVSEPKLNFSTYAKITNDEVLSRYIVEETLDLGTLLLDRKARKTGYGPVIKH